MAGPLTLAQARTYPVPVEPAFDRTLATSLPTLFSRWYGPLPPIRSVDGPEPWGLPGQRRTIRTGDGATMREELLTVARPTGFTYRLTGITGPFGFLTSSVDGAWRFEPVGAGTRIEWRWTVHPASALATVALRGFGALWRGYARQSLARLEPLIAVTDA